MTVNTDPKSAIQVTDELVNTLRNWMPSLHMDQRTELVDKLMKGYCKDCGSDLSKERYQRCYCLRDD